MAKGHKDCLATARIWLDCSAMAESSSKYLTVRELAEFLHLKERKIYALAAEGKIPCSRATGKLLFPREGVEQWLASHTMGTATTTARTERPLLFVGRPDTRLDWDLPELGRAEGRERGGD